MTNRKLQVTLQVCARARTHTCVCVRARTRSCVCMCRDTCGVMCVHVHKLCACLIERERGGRGICRAWRSAWASSRVHVHKLAPPPSSSDISLIITALFSLHACVHTSSFLEVPYNFRKAYRPTHINRLHLNPLQIPAVQFGNQPEDSAAFQNNRGPTKGQGKR